MIITNGSSTEIRQTPRSDAEMRTVLNALARRNRYSANSDADVQIFLTSGTWTKPDGAVRVVRHLIGAGGGGGGTDNGVTEANTNGGGQGSSGFAVIFTFFDS